MTLIDGRVGVGPAARIRVRNGNPAELRTADDMGSLVFGYFWIEQRVVFGCIAVRPSIHGDGGDVPRRIESAIFQGAPQLIADIAFEGFERGGQKLGAAGSVLIMLGQTGFAGRTHHVNQDRILGRFGTSIDADVDVCIQM